MSDPVWLTAVLRGAGLKVTELDGAYQRGHGDFGTIWGCVDHHTGSSGNSSPWSIAQHPSLGLCSQLFLNRKGEYFLCGVGVAWHAGVGSWKGIQANNANQVTIGTEADNNGTEGWSSAQYWSYVRGQAAILNKLGVGSDRSIGHKEWAGPAQGKWDPGGMNMAKFRADIANVQKELRGVKPVVIENQINRIVHFSPWLGKEIDKTEQNTRGHNGKFRRFEHGTVYWNAANGAIPVPTNILEVYKQFDWEHGLLGMPKRYHAIAREDGKDVGDIQGFDGGVIYRRYGQPGFIVHGLIGDRWFKSEGAERGHLGWPTSNEYVKGDVIIQDFQFGQLRCDKRGVVTVDKGDHVYLPPGR